jgi:hypothetical protein
VLQSWKASQRAILNWLLATSIVCLACWSNAVLAQTVPDTIAFIWSGIEEGSISESRDETNKVQCSDRWSRVGPGEFRTSELKCNSPRLDDARFTHLKVTLITKCRYLVEDAGTAYALRSSGKPAEVKPFTDRILLDFGRVRPWVSRGIPPSGTLQPMLLGALSSCVEASCKDGKCQTPSGCDDRITTRYVARTHDEITRWQKALTSFRTGSCPGLTY